MKIIIASLIGALTLAAGTAPDVNPSHILPQPSLEERADDPGECIVYQTRVAGAPIIDWECAEATANMDGGDYYAKNFARAIIAVRDHDYVERK